MSVFPDGTTFELLASPIRKAKTVLQRPKPDKFGIPHVVLERAHRDGPKIDGKPQHLLIKLNCYQDKIKVLQQQRQVLSDDTFYCVEDLTKIDLE